MSDKLIEVGDYVAVYLDAEGNNVEYGVVLYTPCATGDAWHIHCKDGTMLYVQTYSVIYRKPKP